VHRELDLTGEQAFPQPAHEHAGAADLVQPRPGDVAERGQPDQFGLEPGPFEDEAGDLARLRHRHRALTGAEPQH
jgi:hypothetical protein